jgi:cob(I)alamin adenosyltransferase
MKGDTHLITGNIKLLTATAFGIAIKAIAEEKRVYFAQLMDHIDSKEIEVLKKSLPAIITKIYPVCIMIEDAPTKKEIAVFHSFLFDLKGIILSNKFDVVIIDKKSTSIFFNTFLMKEFIDVINQKPVDLEIIIIDSIVSEEFIKIADSITQIKEIQFV